MANFKSGVLETGTTTGNQAITGVGFQPTLVMFFHTGSAGAAGGAANAVHSMGAATSSSEQWAGYYVSQDAQATSNVHCRITDASCFTSISVAGATTFQASFVSMDADGFTINLTTAPGASQKVAWLAIGGAQVQAKLGTITTPVSTGDDAHTGVGFQPDGLILYAPVNSTSAPPVTLNQSNDGSIGWASATNQAVTGYRAANAAATSSTVGRQRTDQIFAWPTDDTGGFIDASLVSLDSDGFTLNWPTATAAANYYFYVAIKGIQVGVGAFNQKTSTGTQATTGVGFTPKALLVQSFDNTSTTSNVATQRVSFGITDGTSQFAMWRGDQDSAATMIARRYQNTSKLLELRTEASGSDSANAEATISSFDADGFTVNWSTADATARQIIYLALGDAAATKGKVSFSEFEVPFKGTKGKLSFAEFEAPFKSTKGRLSFTEFETPLVGTKGLLSFSEFEVPTVGLTSTRGLVSFAEFETPFKATKGRLSFLELESPFKGTRGRLSFSEFETPFKATRGRLSFSEFEAPFIATRGLVSFSEFETPLVGTHGLVSFAEFETPSLTTRGLVSWAEFNVPVLGATDTVDILDLVSRRRSFFGEDSSRTQLIERNSERRRQLSLETEL